MYLWYVDTILYKHRIVLVYDSINMRYYEGRTSFIVTVMSF